MSVKVKQERIGLRGKDFEPPRKPDILTNPAVVAFNDRRYGKQKGRAVAGGYEMEDAGGVPHAERLIDAQSERAIEDQRHGFRFPKENADKVRQDAVEQQTDGARELAKLDKQDGKLKGEEDALGRRHGPSRIGYFLTLLVLYLLSLPVDFTAAMWTPLPPAGQWMLALLIGAGMVLAAHQAAKKVEDLHEAYGQRDKDLFGYRQEQFSLVVSLLVPLAVIVATALWRGQALADDEQATGGLVHGGAANFAFALLALLAFAVAVLVGIGFRRMQPLWEVRKARAEIQAEREKWQQMIDHSERLQRQAELTLAYLDEREQHTVQAIYHWASERKARLRQRAANVAMRERRKAEKKVGEASVAEPEPITDPVARYDHIPVDLKQLANEVQARATANGHVN